MLVTDNALILSDPQPKLLSYDAKELASTAVSLARLDHYDGPLLSLLGAAFLAHRALFRGQELANLAWGLAKLKHRDDGVMQAIAELLLLPPQGTADRSGGGSDGTGRSSDVAAADAASPTTGSGAVSKDPYMRSEGSPAPTHTIALSSQEATNIAYAFAVLGCGTPALFRRLSSSIETSDRQRGRTGGSGASRIPSGLTAGGGDAAVFVPTTFNRQDLANLCHAFAVAQVRIVPKGSHWST